VILLVNFIEFEVQSFI